MGRLLVVLFVGILIGGLIVAGYFIMNSRDFVELESAEPIKIEFGVDELGTT